MAAGVGLADLDWIAIVAAMAANIVLGFLWFSKSTPTGKAWMKGMGYSPDMKVEGGKMGVSMGLMVVGTFLLMFVLQHVFIAFRDSMLLDDPTLDDISYGNGALGAFFTWLGFFLPQDFGKVSWEGKSWGFLAIVTGYNFVSLQIAGAIFATFL